MNPERKRLHPFSARSGYIEHCDKPVRNEDGVDRPLDRFIKRTLQPEQHGSAVYEQYLPGIHPLHGLDLVAHDGFIKCAVLQPDSRIGVLAAQIHDGIQSHRLET